jgi:hypothetical protein
MTDRDHTEEPGSELPEDSSEESPVFEFVDCRGVLVRIE